MLCELPEGTLPQDFHLQKLSKHSQKLLLVPEILSSFALPNKNMRTINITSTIVV